MTRIEFLEEIKESLTSQLSCISDSVLKNMPNERFKDEWNRVQDRLTIVNELLDEEKDENTKDENKIEFREFNFTDENFGEETENVLIWNNNCFVLISIFENEITIKKYYDVLDLFKEFITNRNELEFYKVLVKDQDNEITDLRKNLKD